MASPLILALAATTALVAAPVMACEGQGCWGMAPVQELNPGYTPDYGQFAGPPQAPDDGQQYGEAQYGPDSPPPGYGPQDYGDRHSQMRDPRPYVGPTEGLAPDYRTRQAYAPPPPPPGGPAYGYDDQRDGGYQGQDSDDRGYGPGDDRGYRSPGDDGEPADAYRMAPPSAPPAPSFRGYHRYSDGAEPHMAGQGMSAEYGPPAPPYQSYSRGGYERSQPWTTDRWGNRSRSYAAGSINKYEYDSGWVQNDGSGQSFGQSYGAPQPGYGPEDAYGPPPSYGDGPGYGPAPAYGYGQQPCAQCGDHH